MISYYSAVFLTALLMLGLLMYVVRKRNNDQRTLVLKVVGFTTGMALLLPTLLNSLTLIQAGLLMALLAALAGAVVPVAELLPQKGPGSEEETATVMKAVTETDIKEQHQTAIEPMLVAENEGQKVLKDAPGIMTEEGIAVEEENEVEPEGEPETEFKEELDADKEIETDEVTEVEEVSEVIAEELTETEEEVQAEADEDEQSKITMVLPETFSETMAEVMLMNGYLALKDDEEEEAIDSFSMVYQRASVTDQRMMAYMELKLLMPEVGKTAALIQLGESLVEGKVEFTPMQRAYIEKHTHYLKRLASLLNAHGVTLEQPYSAMPDELKEMAMTYQE